MIYGTILSIALAFAFSPTLAIGEQGTSSGVADAPIEVSLTAAGLLHVKLTGSMLRPSTTYKGWLLLTAEGQSNRWEVTLTTGGRGILAAGSRSER